MMLALLRQLVYELGVDQADIAIGDTVAYFANQYYDLLHEEFPDVRYLDYEGRLGRTGVQQSSTPLYWSSHPSGSYQDYAPASYVEADYVINMANLKSHVLAGVTLCGKNYYGSLVRYPGQSGYYDLHNDLPSSLVGMGYYRNLVDLMGHAHIGGKTLLYLIDGLYAGRVLDPAPTRLNSAPFNGDWSSSLFASQDPVAIDSVALDFLQAEPGWTNPHMSGSDDYLHESAEAESPLSGTFYDPDHSGDVARLASLGVHEHWNNQDDKQYSRNLGIGNGIELVSLSPSLSDLPCDDGLDNDVDGQIDYPNDSGCTGFEDQSEEPDCMDGFDNDLDGFVDFPEDRECRDRFSSTESPECQDGISNDSDGLVDFPDDPGCADRWGTTESPECNDGIDNDGDTLVDYPADPNCVAAWVVSEAWVFVPRCGLGVELTLVLAPLLLHARRRRRSRQ